MSEATTPAGGVSTSCQAAVMVQWWRGAGGWTHTAWLCPHCHALLVTCPH
jgi:hypothetical protein